MPSPSPDILAAEEWMSRNGLLIQDAVAGWWDTGEWPTLMSLGRAAMRRGDLGAFDALRTLPKPLGRLEYPDERIVFRLRAMVAVPSASALLGSFIRTLQVAYDMLLSSEEEHPTLCAKELRGKLGLTEDETVRLSRLIFIENWILGGGSGSADGDWTRNIDDSVLPLRDVKNVDDYLRIEAARFWEAGTEPPAWVPVETPLDMLRERLAAEPALPTRNRRASRLVQQSNQTEPALRAGQLHPSIVREKTVSLLAESHFDEAVRDAALNLRDFLRRQTGRNDLDGANLVDMALAGASPLIEVADMSTRTGKKEQEGWHMLASGCVAVMRNPVAHRSEFTDQAATFEALATMSLVARQIDAAKARADAVAAGEPAGAPGAESL